MYTGKNSILVVDDEKANLEILLKILGQDYIIYMTKSGSSAIQMAEKFLPDLILLDIIMPDMDGYDVLKHLKKSDKTKDIPVIFITGLDSSEDEEKGLALEAADFIHKPFTDMNVKLRVRNQIQIINNFRAIEKYAHDFIKLNATIEAAEEKSKFFAKISHEMRTPLSAIIGLSDMILDEGSFSDESWDNIEKINNAGSTLLSMVNDILDIAKIEADKFQLTPVEYDTLALINDTVTQNTMYKGSKAIKFILHADENIPVRLYGDDIRIRQILNNLLSNAYKYTKEGSIELNIRCEPYGDDIVQLIMFVKDTGQGISKENLGNVFSEYSRVDLDYNRKISGTGLGLSITKMLIDMMDGSISVESDYGKGSTFTVRIPQKIISYEVIGSDVSESIKKFVHAARKNKQKMMRSRIILPYARVLVVDDIVNNLNIARGMMKPYKIQVDCVTSGQEAINAVREEKVKYNAIFMDHLMPGMDGVEALRIIREEIGTEYARKVPVIAFTANALTGNQEMFLHKGFQAFLTKPFELSRLDAVIREWVRDEEQEKIYGDAFLKQEHDRLFEEKIEGMDMRKALERFSGDREVFLEILQSFTLHTRALLEKTKNVNKDNLSDYSINIHGIKSSCRGICAEDLSNQAEAMENAARTGNLAFVEANNAAFSENVYKLITDIETTLSNVGVGEKAKEKLKRDKPYKEALEKLKTACANYQVEEIESAMKEINCFDYTADDGLVQWLRENIAQMNYKEIAGRLGAS
jgi:signal transduction histidine kinase/HPt (histidine-containing phosphotransfer) domain-containing protein